MALPVQYYGSDALRKESAAVTGVSREMIRFAEQMKESLRKEQGIGLAAPQVGRNIRLVIIDTRQDEELPPDMLSEGEKALNPLMPVALFNPVTTPVGTEKSRFTEGCLSLPGIEGEVIRPIHVRMKATLDDGGRIELDCGGLLARCLQHEVDHLDGVLFVDRLTAFDRVRVAPQLHNLKTRTKRGLSRV